MLYRNLKYLIFWTQVIFGWKHLPTQDLWSKVQPSLSADVIMPIDRGTEDMFSVVHTINMTHIATCVLFHVNCV